ncbi:olfactory receptor 14A16-like [Ornithorhynchus anatinus]|uniref:olfactory receptor 14A16-like n=1 Tax=Ornithorhynchus anatinus TaxID=9258 RepID=UPI0010A76747|nr:olfactory receptor 14A16-like [Ornithorhynchus anatinus]
MVNHTTVMEFVLLGFSEVRELQLVHAVLFLLLYLVALTGNLLIAAITTLDWHLHTPMYFFLRHLSILDLCLISVTLPKSNLVSLTTCYSISFLDCCLQVLLVLLFATSELFILTAMSYNHYTATCHPLRYEVIMAQGACGKMAATSWLSKYLLGASLSAGALSLPICGSREIQQIFCDILSLLKISCSEEHTTLDLTVATGFCLTLFCFVSIVVSYMHIFSTLLRIQSAEGRSKTFSTCLPHLTITSAFFTTGSFPYLAPTSESPSALDLLVYVFYTMVPPALNPLIYSLRNRDIKTSLGRVLQG